MNKLLLFFITVLKIIVFCPFLSVAQDINFRKVSLAKHRLGYIGNVTQDKDGYLWIASGKGLIRYDGYEYKTFLNDSANPNSLAEDHLEKVYADSKGILWILTWTKGLDRMDPLTGKFTHFKHNPADPSSISDDFVRAILQDHEGSLWIGTHGGLDRFDPKTEKFIHYRSNPKDSSSLSCNRVRALYEDRKGTLWVGTGSTWAHEGGDTDEGGLNRFDRSTGKFTRYIYNPSNQHSLINNKVQAIFEDSKGGFWVGTSGDGLHTLDRETGLFQRHPFDPIHPEKLSRPEVVNSAGFADFITFIDEDASGNIWIGTLGNGLNLYDRQNYKCVHHQLGGSAINDPPNSIFKSRDGILWISTFSGMLYTVDPFHKSIPHINTGSWVSTITEEPSNILWIGTEKGLIRKEEPAGTTKTIVHDPNNSNSPSSNKIFSIYIDKKGLLWLGTPVGLDRFDPQSGSYIHYKNEPQNANSIDSGGIFPMVGGGQDSIWMATNNGLVLMNTRANSFTHYRYNVGDSNSLSSNDIRSLYFDNDGKVWIGTFLKGLNRMDPATGKLSHFLKNITEIHKLFQDSDKTLWVATDAGIFKKGHADIDFVKHIDSRGNLESEYVLSILEDNKKNLYFFTGLRMYKINLLNNQTAILEMSQEGSDAKENFDLYSYFFASYRGKDGSLYFGNGSGYFVFSPDKISGNPVPPEIVISDLRINGKSLIKDGNSLADVPIKQANEIHLAYGQNNINIDFAGIHYARPEYNQHQYILQNYEDEWHVASKEKTATYTNLQPGKYIFRIKAANSDGVWSERDLKITIIPPWWKRWWAYVLYSVFLAAIIFLFDRIQRRRIINRERERSRDRELAQSQEIEKAYSELKATQAQLIQSEKMASLGELTAGIAHEIQNPLNFVNNFSEVNNELLAEMKIELDKGNLEDAKGIANSVIDNGHKINHHGKRAASIVKGMLQHSQSSSGAKEPTNINALTDEYLKIAYHGLRAKDKSFNATMKTDFDESIGSINIIPQDIGRVILNLIDNAFYVVNEKSQQNISGYEPIVSVTTKKEGNKIFISVNDNGNGIPQKIFDKIFQPFFTTKPTGQGTGLGLSLSYDIIKAHGGELKVETKEGEGCTFIVKLPF